MSEINHSDLAVESRLLAKRTMWCGAVCALAVLLTTLNLLPPIEIEYDVSSEVLVSPARFDELTELASRDAEAWLDGEDRPILVTEVKLLDDSESQLLTGGDSDGSILLVEIKTRWKRSFSEDLLARWLDDESQGDALTLDPELATQSSLAKWNVETAEHYAAREAYLAESETAQPANSNSAFSLATTSSPKPPASLASTQTKSAGIVVGGQDQPTMSLASTKRRTTPLPDGNTGREESSRVGVLADRVEVAQYALASIQQRQRIQMESELGVLEFAQAASLTPTSTAIPLWMAASVLILGCCSAAAAGWFQHRSFAGGAYDPKTVAVALSRSGVPISGGVEIPSNDARQSDWLDFTRRHASKTTRAVGRNLTRICEMVLWFWVYMIGMRLVLDPMWRTVFLESPLAAFGRVLSGMP